MKLVDQFQFPHPIQSIAVSPQGKRVVVAVGTDDWIYGKTAAAKREQSLHTYQHQRGRLVAESKAFARGIPSGSEGKQSGRFKFSNTHIACCNERIVVIACLIRDAKWRERVEVATVDRKTGKVLRHRVLNEVHTSCVTGAIAASAKHAFIGVQQAVICLDTDTLDEVCRTPEFDSDGTPLQEDVFGEESMAPGGFAYDPKKKLLYTAPGYYNAGVVYCYKFNAARRTLTRQWRREVVENRPTRRDAELLSIRAMVPNPGGMGATAAFMLEDLRVDLQGEPLRDRAKALETATQLRKTQSRIAAPKTARLGWIGVFAERSETWIELRSDINRDFDMSADQELDEKGKSVKVGYALCSKNAWEATPIYLDKHRVLVVTPTGLLHVTDLRTGVSAAEYDLREVNAQLGEVEGSGVTSLALIPQTNRLVIGMHDGTVVSLDVGQAKRLSANATKQTIDPPQTVKLPRRRKPSKPPIVRENSGFSMLTAGYGGGVAITKDGRTAACGSCVWDVRKKRNLAVFETHSEGVALSDDGRRLLTGASDGMVSWWEIATSESLWRGKSNGDAVRGVALSPSGKFAASAHASGKVLVWDVGTGQRLATLAGHKSYAKTVAFSPDEDLLVSGSTWDPVLRVWDWSKKKTRFTLRGHTSHVTGVVWPPDGKHIISASDDKTLRVWDVTTRRCVRLLKGHTKPINALCLAPDGRTLISGSDDKTVRMWDFQRAGRCPRKLVALGELDSVALSENGLVVGAIRIGGTPNGVQMWNATTGEDLGQVGDWRTEGHVGLGGSGARIVSQRIEQIRTATIDSKTGQRVETCLIDRIFSVWDVARRKRVAAFRFTGEGWPPAGSQWAAISDNRKCAIFTDYYDGDQQIFVWKVGGRRVPRLLNPQAATHSVALTPDARFAISGHYDGTCCVWDIGRSRLRSTLAGHSAPVAAVALSPDGALALSGSSDETVRLWDVVSNECRGIWPAHEREITAVAFSGDGSLAASSSEDGLICVWDVKTGACRHTLDSPPNQSVRAITFNAHGARLATVHWNSVRLWDMATGRAEVQYQSEGHSPTHVAFHEDAESLISLSGPVVRRWQLPT